LDLCQEHDAQLAELRLALRTEREVYARSRADMQSAMAVLRARIDQLECAVRDGHEPWRLIEVSDEEVHAFCCTPDGAAFLLELGLLRIERLPATGPEDYYYLVSEVRAYLQRYRYYVMNSHFSP
jgi:hypothetical protein